MILCRTVKIDEVQYNLSPASLINLVSPSVIEEFAPVPREFGKMDQLCCSQDLLYVSDEISICKMKKVC